MMDKRKWANPQTDDSFIHTARPSGPRWAIESAMSCRTLTFVLVGSLDMIPAIPHILISYRQHRFYIIPRHNQLHTCTCFFELHGKHLIVVFRRHSRNVEADNVGRRMDL